MIGDNDCVCAQINRSARIVFIHNTFKDKFALPEFADPGDIRPCQGWIKLTLRPCG